MNVFKLKETPSQTAGPYVHIGLMPQYCGVATPPQLGAGSCPPEVEITGTVWDGDGVPVRDVLIECWQANAAGDFSDGGHAHWQRIASDFDTGVWRLQTVKPAATTDTAPHVLLWIVARGINMGLHTRVYFGDDDHACDATLTHVPQERRSTLIARPSSHDPNLYHFDIRLQGDGETVFFDV